MEKFTDEVNCIGGVCVAVLTAIFGQFWYLFAGLLIGNIVDWLTGWYYSHKKGECSSKIGARGVLKKVGYWVVILIAFYIAFAFKQMGEVLGVNLAFMQFVGWFVLANYLVNEIRSIFENLVKLGVDIPQFLVKGLKITSELIEKTADGKLPKGDDGK